jgi:autotransporter-associated beta strand protein
MPYKKKQGPNSNYRCGIICSLAIAILPLSSTITQATDRYWSVTSGDWSNASFWGGTEPISCDDAYIQNNGTATITQYNAYCRSLYLGDSGIGKSGTIQMNGGSLYVSVHSYVGYSGTGTFTQTGGTHAGGTNSLSALYLGYNSGSSGAYNLSNTGLLSAVYEYIGFSGAGTFTQTGGTNSTSLYPHLSLQLGYNTGSSGTYDLSGTGQLSADFEDIGGYGTGTFTQTDGTNSITTDLYIGDGFGSRGTYNLSGTGRLYASGEYIGRSGTGTFTQTGGTNSTGYYGIYLGYNSISSGTYNLTGGTLILKSLGKGSGTAAFNFGGGRLQASGAFSTSLPMTLTGTSGNANIDTAGYVVTLSGVLSGDGGLNKLGSGILRLSSNNTYTGGTVFTGGYIEASSLAKLGFGSLTFNGGGLFFTNPFDPSTFGISINSGGALLNTGGYWITLSNVLTGEGGLNKLGFGTLTISNMATYGGNTTVSGGSLIFSGGIGASGTTLIDVESGTAVLKTVSVTKSDLDIYTAASAKFEVADHTHVVGVISGSGTTQVDSGASLTAASISQGTLTLGIGARVTIQPIPGGPLGDTITAVPEPSTFVLLAAAFLMPAYSRARRWIK